MATFYTAAELHDYIKKISTSAANKLANPETMYWRAVYGYYYKHYVLAYGNVFSVPSPLDLARHRRTVGDTVMSILSHYTTARNVA